MATTDAQEVIETFKVDTTQLSVEEVLKISDQLQAEITAAYDKSERENEL